MSLPTQGGRYIAKPTEWGVAETGPNKLLTFTCGFDLLQFHDGTDWQPVSADLQITAFVYLMKREGAVNENQVRSLRAAFGWDGGVRELNDGYWSDVEVQLTIDLEEYNGKTRPKVNWINPRDYEGGNAVQKSDTRAIQSLEAKYGAKFRALAGGSPRTAQGGTTAPAAPPPKPARPNPLPDAKKLAWEAFKALNGTMDRPTLETTWRETLAAYFPGRDMASLGAAEFLQFKTNNFVRPEPAAPPFDAGSPPVDDDDIPF